MTAIKIPLSIDHRATECLEEYGTYHRLPDMTLNDRCLIGYVLKTIRDTLPTAVVDTYDSSEWTAEDLSSLEVHITTVEGNEPKWCWSIELQASVENGCKYSIHVYSIGWDKYTYIGTVDQLTTLLAILCSEVDFSFVPGEDGTHETIMLMKARVGIIKGLNVDQVQKAAEATYNGGWLSHLQDYLRDISRAIGGGGVLNGKPSFMVNGKNGNLIFHIELRLYDISKERPRSLGTTDNIIAALIITCGGVEYSGEIAPTFPEGEGLDVHALEEEASDAYLAAQCGNNWVPICNYIADTFRDIGYGAAVRQGLHFHIMVREAGSKTLRYMITPSNPNYGILNFDVYYYSGDKTLYLGRTSSVTAVVAIVCTSLSFRGKES